ncbi:hypothetical protein ADL00_23310, partial [Streptomyces sp. AS58]|uniref:polyketide synthase dehydratase domain-containing protein n=1 Tax=Streptomyces sp. AS58 TaxID=1519489 RepID=UPI0006C29069
LDAALHTLLPGVVDPDRQALVPFGWEGVTIHAAGAGALRVRLTVTDQGAESLDVSLTVADATGAPVATVETLSLRPLSKEALRSAAATGAGDALYAVRWNALPDSTPKTAVPASEILEVVSGDRTP